MLKNLICEWICFQLYVVLLRVKIQRMKTALNKNEILERELSVSVLANSKTWESKYKTKILRILKKSGYFNSLIENCADEKEVNKVILEECNIFANPSYVYFKGNGTFKMNSADGTIHFNLSFSQNSVYLRVRLRERFVNPQLLKQLAVYKIKEQYFLKMVTLPKLALKYHLQFPPPQSKKLIPLKYQILK